MEGQSDKDALIPYLEDRLLSSRVKVTVKEIHGDILTAFIDGQRIYRVSPSNVKGEIKKEILQYLKTASVKAEQIKAKDICKIYYVTDTDYCFHSKLDGHKNKSKCLEKIFNFGSIELVKDKFVPFDTIYFSKHLEHIIANKIENLSKEEKQKLSLEFGEKSLTEKGFYEKTFKNPEIKKWENYRKSYEEIQTYKGRACNMNNLLDEIDELVIKSNVKN